jgi:hypothetical protein
MHLGFWWALYFQRQIHRHTLCGYHTLCNSRLAANESVTLLVLPTGGSFTEEAIHIAQALFDAAPHGASWQEKQLEDVCTSEAAIRALSALPLSRNSKLLDAEEAEHAARMLRLMGCLAEVCSAPASALVEAAGVDEQCAALLVDLFS